MSEEFYIIAFQIMIKTKLIYEIMKMRFYRVTDET